MKSILLLLLLLVPALFCAADPADEANLRLAGRVHALLETKCNECHGSKLEKPQGKFGYVLDLKRIADNPEYIVRGVPEKSEFYRLLLEEEMPPDDHPKTPPLTGTEKALMREWVMAGAPHALPVAPLPPEPLAKAPAAPPKPAPMAVDPHLSPKDRAHQARITLQFVNVPAGEIFTEIGKLANLRINYSKPVHEPRLSIHLGNGTAFEALEYLALCGNYVLKYKGDGVQVGPNAARAK